jgi:DNA-binding XRE family transcriptional regulator
MLHAFDGLPCIALVPIPVEGFSHEPELDDEVGGQVLRFALAAFLVPEPEEGGFVSAHDHLSVGATDERTPSKIVYRPQSTLRHRLISGIYEALASTSILKVSIEMRQESILKVSTRQIKAARALLAWSQEQLAAAAAVSIPTIKRLEAQDGPLGGRDETGSKIRLALAAAGVEFIDENGGGPGVRLRHRPEKR